MDEGVDPQNMCSHLYGAMGILKSLSGHASSDLVFVFQEWLEEIEKECAEILNREPECSAGRMSEYLGLSEESARFVMRHVSSGINGDCRDDSKKTDNFKRSG